MLHACACTKEKNRDNKDLINFIYSDLRKIVYYEIPIESYLIL